MLSSAPATSAAVREPVLADALPGDRIRDALLILGYVLAIGLGAQIAVHLPSTPVPVTGQTLAVLLGAVVLGPRRAAAGTLLYLGGGLAGIPLLAAAGTASLGYVFGFVLAAIVVGLLAERGWDRSVVSLLVLMCIGNIAIYAIGATFLGIYLGVSAGQAINLGVQPFMLGDAVKIVLALGLVPAAWRLTGK
jgi:biotin transport system substrate-specific component